MQQVSTWIVVVCGWIVVAATGIYTLYWLLDRAMRLLGLMGWLFATFQQVQKDHGWVDQNCPWWWHWVSR